MAEIELQELKTKKDKFTIKKKNLMKILDICEDCSEGFDEDFYYISNRVKLAIDVMNIEIHELEKQSKCDHNIVFKDLWAGNDSHYDYYIDKCSECDKIIKQYKI